MASSFSRIRAALVCTLILTGCMSQAPSSQALPRGFQSERLWTQLQWPSAVRFTPQGRIFITEKRGRIYTAQTAGAPLQLVANIEPEVYDYWDRGLLGLAVDPGWPSRPYIYAMYTYDAPPGAGSVAPYYNDACADPLGKGCPAIGRLERLQLDPNSFQVVGRRLLVQDWCQQYPSHSVGDLAFDRAGNLYASGGEGASFTFYDMGSPTSNPCGDPVTTDPNTSQGGSMRSQDLRLGTDPVNLSGSLIRINPDTGEAASGNPLAMSADANARRIVAYGFRNPFRFTIRPGTDEVWLGDVGAGSWEEIDWIDTPFPAQPRNYGWPCREAGGPWAEAQNHSACANMTDVQPIFAYVHWQPINSTDPDSCKQDGGSVTGVAFAPSTWPAPWTNALLWADYTRGCIWGMDNTSGWPNMNTHDVFNLQPGLVDLQRGADNAVWGAEHALAGAIIRISWQPSSPPQAVAEAQPAWRATRPSSITWSAAKSTDPDNDALVKFEWDLNLDGIYNEGTGVTRTQKYSRYGRYGARVRVTDATGQVSVSSIAVAVVGDAPPNLTITSPASGSIWKPNTAIPLKVTVSDAHDGSIPASRIVWTVSALHCQATDASACHEHALQQLTGASTTFAGADHDQPSWLLVTVQATDSIGLRRINKRCMSLSGNTAPIPALCSPETETMVVAKPAAEPQTLSLQATRPDAKPRASSMTRAPGKM